MEKSDLELDKWEFATTIDGQFLVAQAHLRLSVAMKVLPTLMVEHCRLTGTMPNSLERETLNKQALEWADSIIKENARSAGLPPKYYQ